MVLCAFSHNLATLFNVSVAFTSNEKIGEFVTRIMSEPNIKKWLETRPKTSS